MKLNVISCPDWHAGECRHAESVARFGSRPSSGVCVHACGRGTLAGETIEVADPKPVPPKPVPREHWPTWATWVAGHQAEGDIGVGSTIERMLGAGGRAFKATFAAMGIDCGCGSRRDKYDKLYPYA